VLSCTARMASTHHCTQPLVLPRPWIRNILISAYWGPRVTGLSHCAWLCCYCLICILLIFSSPEVYKCVYVTLKKITWEIARRTMIFIWKYIPVEWQSIAKEICVP
jgi:hypothetical protein